MKKPAKIYQLFLMQPYYYSAGWLSEASGGRREQIFDLAKSGIASKIAGLFLDLIKILKAMCDGPSALPLELLEEFLIALKRT